MDVQEGKSPGGNDNKRESQPLKGLADVPVPTKKPKHPDEAESSISGDGRDEMQGTGGYQQSYLEMVELMEKQDLIFTAEYAECPLCFSILPEGEGIVLRDCLHTFCRDCLVDCIQYTDMTPVKCPQPDYNNCPCSSFVREREIKAVVPPEVYKQYLDRSLKLAENQSSNSFHCRTLNCSGWCVVEEGAKVFICPVCKKENFIQESDAEEEGKSFLSGLELADSHDLLSSVAVAECPVCFTCMAKGEGVMLRECLHVFCRDCLAHCVQYGDDSTATVPCPYRDAEYVCECQIQEREIKALVSPEIFEKYLARSVNLAEHHSENSFHCRTPDCTGWAIFEDDVNVFDCPVCKKQNCITCAGIHEGMNCLQYQRYLAIHAEKDANAKKSLAMLKKMIKQGKALHCPKCQIILIKTGGCDGLTCTYCKTEICWATKGFRWGKNGKGDTSGGCRCKVNGKLCHPKCRNCH